MCYILDEGNFYTHVSDVSIYPLNVFLHRSPSDDAY